jgi:ABC-type sugar transport system ATPase subunit
VATITLEHVATAGASRLHDVTFQVEDGEWVVLTGPTGSGADLVLRVVEGLAAPSAGRVLIDGLDVAGTPPGQRRVRSIRGGTAAANGHHPHRVLAGVKRLLRRAEPPKAAFDRLREILADDLARHPLAVLASEPLAAVPPGRRHAARAELLALHGGRRATILHATSDPEEALAVGQRVVVMRDGEVIQSGTPLMLYERPVDLFVARYFGSPSLNTFEGQVEIRNGTPVFEAGGLRLATLPPSAALVAGLHMLLCVRPQDVELADGESGLPAVVDAVEPIGHEQTVYTTVAGLPRVTAVAPRRPMFARGARIRLRFPAERVLLFDIDGIRYLGTDAI